MCYSLLLVENDPDQLDLLSYWCVQAGYRVTSVLYANQAIEAAAANDYQVALIDMDEQPTVLFELMRKLQAITPSIEIVLLSEHPYLLDVAHSEGAFACIEKPCCRNKLEAVIEEAFECVEIDQLRHNLISN